MHREMRDISGDLRERADLLVGQMVAEQARFRAALTELEKEKAMRRQQLEAAVQAVHRLVNVITVQHVLHRALNSAVTALDAHAETSKGPLQNEKGESPSPSLKEAAPGASPESASVGNAVQGDG
jgi:ABC-type transporter Mla subunit MlaD